MRLAVLAGLLCASPIVLCQSAVPDLANSEQPQASRPAQAADFTRLTRNWNLNFHILLPSGKFLPLFDNTLV